MTMIALTGARILADGVWRDDHVVLMQGWIIKGIVAAHVLPPSVDVHDLDGGVLIPGFIDTQVNGGGGVLFNDQPSVDGIATIAAAHRRFGTTALLPTLISDDLSKVATAIAAVDAAIEAGVPGIIGIHIEGPFLNSGKRGIHDASKFRQLDSDAVALLSSLKNGRMLVTLAPELAPPGMIKALVARGVTVAAGHTLASYDDMQRAIDEGLSGVTHLFNAMTQMESRAPGVVGAALDSDLTCGIIADGHHVHPATLRAAYHAKGADGLMLVTDAMPTVGSDQQTFKLGGAVIAQRGGRLTSTDGTLAGSALDMASALRGAMAMLNIDLATASAMASRTPARFMGLADSHGRIAPGYRANLIHLNDALVIQSIWQDGMLHQAL
jgi:N-acetylglucosamine-6-phosphate deacetylase